MSAGRTARLVIAGALALGLVGCAAGALDVEEETVGASASPSPSAGSPSPSEPSATPSAAPWIEASADDGSIVLSHPADWTATPGNRPWGSDVELSAPDGTFALLVAWQSGVDLDDTCFDTGWTFHATEPATPFLGAAPAAAQDAVIATASLGDDYTLVALMTSAEAERGCVGLAGLPLGDVGAALATTTYRGDTPGLGAVPGVSVEEFLASDDYATIVEVLRTVRFSEDVR